MRFGVVLALTALAGTANLAMASLITGEFSYTGGATAAATAPNCGANGTFNDDGTVSEDGGFQNWSLAITACQNPAPDLTATFTLSDGTGGSITGSIAGLDVGNEGNVEDVAGTFTITDTEGDLQGLVDDGYTDNFSAAVTITNYQTNSAVGTFIVGAPEPSTMALLGLGGIGIGLLRRRRK